METKCNVGRIVVRCYKDQVTSSNYFPRMTSTLVVTQKNCQFNWQVYSLSFTRLRDERNTQVQGVHKVSLQFEKFITKANEKTDKWKLLQNETCVFKFSSPHLIHLYVDTISCTKHIKTVLDFLHDRCFSQMFLVVSTPPFIEHCVSLSP